MSRPALLTAQWPLLALLLAGIGAITALWFALGQPLAEGERRASGRYVEGVVGQPLRINPLFANLNSVDGDISRLVFSGLTRLGPNGQVLPDLAQRWEISEGGRLYTFHLRPDVTWHSGQPFTAADVTFTYSLLSDPEFPGDPELGHLWRQIQCQEVSDLTVRCELPSAFAPFLAFASVGILPKHTLEGVSAQDLLEHPFNLQPVGTGPFRLTDIDENRAILQRNTNYHLGPPRLRDLELRFYPDEHAAMAALHRDDIQGLLLPPNISGEDLDTLLARNDLRLYSTTRITPTILYLNDRSPIFADRAVRQALALAVDRDAIIAAFLDGRALRADSPIPPGTWAYNPNLELIPYDPARARQLLEEAGWLPGEGGSPREKDGNPLRFDLLTDNDPLRAAIAQELARQLEEVGFQVTVLPVGTTVLIQDFLLPGQYEAAIFGRDPGYDPDPYPAWHSSQIGNKGLNLANYASPRADRVLEQARQTTDFSQRQALYYDFQRIFLTDLPSLPLYFPLYSYFVRDSVSGIVLGTLFDTAARFANVQDWSVEGEAEAIGS